MIDKPKIIVVMTTSETHTIVTGKGAYVINLRTGKVVFHPENPVRMQQIGAVAAGVDLLQNTEGVKGAEELRLQTAKFLTSTTQALTTELATKSARE